MDVRRRISFNMNAGGDTSDPINTDNYLTILALEDGLQAKLSGNTVSYSLDEGNTWTSLASNTYTPTVNKGQTIMFKGNLTPNSSSGIGTFTINKKCNLEGNCMSLLFGDDAVNNNSLSGKDYAFYQLFRGCTTIIHVSETFLPATTLDSYCYRYMFYGCTSLTTAPELPATTLTNDCYYSMFEGCTSLTVAPELPATTLSSNCYQYMFYNCSKLNSIKMLATNISATRCLNSWVTNVSSTGTFVKNPAMTSLPTGNSGIPSGWAVVDDTGSRLITFTVDGVEYRAEEGMTWGEFIDSAYNIYELMVHNGLVYNIGGVNIQKDNINVLSTDILINNMSYTIDDGYFPS